MSTIVVRVGGGIFQFFTIEGLPERTE